MIYVTEQAALQIRTAAVAGGVEGLALRLAARQLPDGSIDYGMGFDNQQPDDLETKAYGVTIVVAPPFKSVLNNLSLDYVEIAPGDFRFIFQNPNDTAHGAPTKR